mmetsp:Transcript_41690/g.100000  ORF Transcript_41690/g.100000 Transcript_41690/m.100000 type:complete len:1258 (+) Transcript_41690:115-3888(+)
MTLLSSKVKGRRRRDDRDTSSSCSPFGLDGGDGYVCCTSTTMTTVKIGLATPSSLPCPSIAITGAESDSLKCVDGDRHSIVGRRISCIQRTSEQHHHPLSHRRQRRSKRTAAGASTEATTTTRTRRNRIRLSPNAGEPKCSILPLTFYLYGTVAAIVLFTTLAHGWVDRLPSSTSTSHNVRTSRISSSSSSSILPSSSISSSRSSKINSNNGRWLSHSATVRREDMYQSKTAPTSPASGNSSVGRDNSSRKTVRIHHQQNISHQSSNNSGSSKKKPRSYQSRPKTKSKTNKPKTANSSKRLRNSIKYMFNDAKKLERQGRWGEAMDMLNKILKKDPKDAYSHLALARLEARRESSSRHHTQHHHDQRRHHHGDTISSSEHTDDVPSGDGQLTKAQRAFQTGTEACPGSVHLWQSWALYEYQSRHNIVRARELFEEALAIEPHNPYVCHAYSLMEKKNAHQHRHHQRLQNDNQLQNVIDTNGIDRAMELLQRGLQNTTCSTAAIVCSLGEALIEQGQIDEARELYQNELPRMKGEKDTVEVYLAAAWLEERHFDEWDTAHTMLERALSVAPSSSLASVALARLEGRMMQHERHKNTANSGNAQQRQTTPVRAYKQHAARRDAANKATIDRLTQSCDAVERTIKDRRASDYTDKRMSGKVSSTTAYTTNTDGRVFNALASVEIKQGRFDAARDVLRRGMVLFPYDHNLFTAAGKVEERVGNFSGARSLYGESLRLEPSSPTLVAYALLELKHPLIHSSDNDTSSIGTNLNPSNYTMVKGLFEEALLLDPRNGPAYNAYGKAEARFGEIDEARSIFERGIGAGCSDSASIFHGYGMLELSAGNVERARAILAEGLDAARRRDVVMTDTPNRDRSRFLSHSLGMLELNSNRPVEALEIFEEGTHRCGNSSRLLLGAALCQMRLGKEDAARSLFEQTIVADKKHPQAWQAWGVMETRAGNFKRASVVFQQGIKFNPHHAYLWLGYASLEAKRGNTMNARTLFAAGLNKVRSRKSVLFQGWAKLELRQENYQSARKLISEALTLHKRNGRGWLIAAQIEEEDGNTGLVSLLLRRGIECSPGFADLYRKLGDYLVNRGKIDDAREVLEKGIELNPMYAPLYHSLAELEARICNLDALARLNKRTSELFHNNALDSTPLPLLDEAFGSRIKSSQPRQESQNVGSDTSAYYPSSRVTALSQKIGSDSTNDDSGGGDDDDGLSLLIGDDIDPMSTLEGLSRRNIMMMDDEDSLVGDLLSLESWEEGN